MNIINGNLSFNGLSSYGNNPKMVILHHAAANHCSIDDIHKWHLENGWAGCGYHYLVRKDGNIYTGRPEAAIGAHCINYNDKSIGICTEGNFENEAMEQVQYNSLVELTIMLLRKYGINKICGHGELNLTDCPGKNFPLERIKEEVSVSLSSGTITAVSSTNSENNNSLNHEDNLQSQSIPYPGYLMKMNPNFMDNNVKLFQEKLLAKGYSLGNYGADGYFGKYTFEAVIAFQRANELLVDGIVGINTWNKLFSS